jgi:hypothetical protein
MTVQTGIDALDEYARIKIVKRLICKAPLSQNTYFATC